MPLEKFRDSVPLSVTDDALMAGFAGRHSLAVTDDARFVTHGAGVVTHEAGVFLGLCVMCHEIALFTGVHGPSPVDNLIKSGRGEVVV